MLDFSPRKVFTVANFVSVSRIIIVPIIGWLLFVDSVAARIAAGVLLALAVFSDFLDGWLARLLDQVSDLGKIIDPLADKLFVILLAIELIILRDFPLWLALVIICKDALIVTAGILVAGRKRVVMQSNIIGKYAFGFQAGLVVSYFLDFPYGEWFFTIASLLFIAASLASYSKALLYVVRSTEQEVVVPPPPQIVPTWARRTAVLLLLGLFLAQLYYWAYENNEVALNIENPQLLSLDEGKRLAEQYCPVFLFSNDDKARPVPIEDYLRHADIRRGNRYLMAVFDESVKQAPLLPVDLADAVFEDTYLALTDTLWPGEAGSDGKVYAAVFALYGGEEEWKVIQYWLFFALEENPTRRAGDWQMAAVYLDSQKRPRYVTLTQAWYGKAVAWDSLEFDGEHPPVYVARGSHNLYFTAGEHGTYWDHERVLPQGVDVTSGDVPFRMVEDFDLEVLTGSEEWVLWPGRWGGPLPGGDRGPRYWNPKDSRLAPWSDPMKFLDFYLSIPR
jgi:CDP-diacylglycerol--glycerol-3-phosphate 3-phosphatidyltransferase